MKKVSMKPLFFLLVLDALAACFIHPVLAAFIKQLGVHDYMFGVSNFAMFVASFLFSPFWGKMSAKYGGAKIFSISLIGYAVGQLLFGLSTTEWMICASRFICGIFLSAIAVSQMIYIMDNSDNVAKDLTIAATIMSVVGPFGFLIGGFLGDWSIMGDFIVQVIFLALIGFMGFFLLKEKKLPEKSSFTIKDCNPFKDFVAAKDILTPLIIIFLCVATLTSFASTAYDNTFNYFVIDQFKFPTSYNGIIKAVVGFIAFFTNTFITMKLLAKTNNFKTVIYVFLLQAIVAIVAIVTYGVIPFVVLSVVYFGLNSMYLPVLQALLNKFKTKNQSALVGLFNGLKSIGGGFGSLSAGFLYGLWPRLPFVVAFVVFAISTFLCVIQFKKATGEGLE